jgi:hypothetical protein
VATGRLPYFLLPTAYFLLEGCPLERVLEDGSKE